MSITKHIDIGEDEVRYGISALDVQYAKEYGQEDELFISNKNGKVYYKRMSEDDENTQIVTYDDTEYNRIDLIQDMLIAHNKDLGNPLYTDSSRIPKSTDTIRYNDSTSNLCLMYYRFDLSVKGKYLKDNTTVNITDTNSDIYINMAFFLDIFPNSGVYVKLSGSKELNSLIAHLPNVDLRTPIKINLTYNEYEEDTESTDKYVTNYPIGFNELIHIDLATIVDSPNSDAESAFINIHNISMENLSLNTHLTESNVDDINALNNFNDNFELAYFDIVFFVNMSTIPQVIQRFNGFKNAKLIDIIPIKDVETIIKSISSTSIITTEDISSTRANNSTIIEYTYPRLATGLNEKSVSDGANITENLKNMVRNTSLISNEIFSLSFVIEVENYGSDFDTYYDDSVGFIEFGFTFTDTDGFEVEIPTNNLRVFYHGTDNSRTWWLGKEIGNGERYVINMEIPQNVRVTDHVRLINTIVSTIKVIIKNNISSSRQSGINFKIKDVRTQKLGDVYKP